MQIREGLSFDDVLLVPQHGVLDSRKDADISSDLVESWPLLVPIISANMPSVTESKMALAMYCSGGIGALHRFCSIEDNIELYKKSRCGVICSIGLKDGIERTKRLIRWGASIFCLDIAHADTDKVFNFVKEWRDRFSHYYLIVGNVAVAPAAEQLSDLGVNAIKVGIGPGAACTTREVTGFGVPQLSAIMDCSLIKDIYPEVKIIADGGIRNSGDIVKALAAGADTVMVGSLLAGCDEAPNPGEYYGNASYRVNGHNAPEGVSGTVARTGSVAKVVKQLAWGIRSGISYAGATNLEELRENAEWVRVTPQAMKESGTRIAE
jgi:IMP dehydrogenase